MHVYVVDAFTQNPMAGNPAAVVPLDAWPDDALMQAMAQEHKHSETAFLVPSDNPDADYHIRWMTPASEVKLCGHATLGSAHVLWTELGFERDTIRFDSMSGILSITRDSKRRIVLDFPTIPIERIEIPDDLVETLGAKPSGVYDSYDMICVFDSQEQVASLDPDFRAMAQMTGVRAIGCTAPGDQHDFVARLFAPQVGVDEDPVTGSLYTMLAPYWFERLGASSLSARQISKRGGNVWVSKHPDQPGRVQIAGHAATYSRGEIVAALVNA